LCNPPGQQLTPQQMQVQQQMAQMQMQQQMQGQPAFVSAQSTPAPASAQSTEPAPASAQQQVSPTAKSGKTETDEEPTPKVGASQPGAAEDIEELEFKESNLTSVERAPRAQRVMDQREMNLWMQLADPNLSSGDGGTNDFGEALGSADPQDFVYAFHFCFLFLRDTRGFKCI
jgi:hypothetical protein